MEGVWLVRLLRVLGPLEHLGLEGYSGGALRRLRRLMVGRAVLLGSKILTVHSGAYEIRQAIRMEDVAGGLGLGINVTCIPDQSLGNGLDGLGEGRDLDDEDESDEE